MADDCVLSDRRDGLCWLTLNRPDRLNAMSVAMLTELDAALAAAGQDPAVLAVAVTGAGRAFSAGGDLKVLQELQTLELPERLQRYRQAQGVIRRIKAIGKPIIAAVNGPAVGAGCDLALACDLIFAAESAFFAQVFVTVGLCNDLGGTFHLPRLVGMCRAKQMMFTGEPVPAARAEAMGMINAVVADDRLQERVAAWVAEFAEKAVPGAAAVTKLALHSAAAGSLDQALEYEALAQSSLMDTGAHKQRIAALLARGK